MRIIMMALSLMMLPAALGAQEAMRRMTLTGTGIVLVAPDMATINLGVSSFDEKASQAMQQNSSAMARIFKSLKEANIEPRDIQTSQLSLNPRWEHRSNSQPRIIGYEALHTLMVRVRALPSVGSVLDVLTKLGANRINSISFGIQKPRPHQDDARRAAVRDARAKAELYAEAAGIELGQILSLSENGGVQRPQPMARMEMAMAASDAVPIAEGELGIRSNVTIVFEIK